MYSNCGTSSQISAPRETLISSLLFERDVVCADATVLNKTFPHQLLYSNQFLSTKFYLLNHCIFIYPSGAPGSLLLRPIGIRIYNLVILIQWSPVYTLYQYLWLCRPIVKMVPLAVLRELREGGTMRRKGAEQKLFYLDRKSSRRGLEESRVSGGSPLPSASRRTER